MKSAKIKQAPNKHSSSTSSSSSSSSFDSSPLTLPYRHRLSFYRLPPIEEVRVDEFILYANDRLKVLKELDVGRIRGLKAEELRSRIHEALRKNLPLVSSADSRKDVISHFVLRLAFCSTPEQRKWFVKQECELFHHRVISGHVDMAAFLVDNDMSEQGMSAEEFKTLEDELRACHPRHKRNHGFERGNYYKVKFTDVLNLVSKRSALVRGGYAFIYKDDLLSVVQNKFREHLNLELTKTFRAQPLFTKDERINAILQGLSQSYSKGMDQTFDYNQSHINPLQIDSLSKQAFPLCAQNMNRNLKKSHHLKHWARVQYGLFLKGAGLPLDGALEFWKREFCKEVGMDSSTFDRKYSYNFRHLYGKEGKRCDWSPYGCGKIITSFKSPGEGEHHGCPYQTFDSERLRGALEETMRERPNKSSFEDWSAVQKSINEIVSLAKDGHYQIACRKEFEVRALPKKPATDLIINHPNVYVSEMLKVCSGKVEIDSFPPPKGGEEEGSEKEGPASEKRKRGADDDGDVSMEEGAPPQKKKA